MMRILFLIFVVLNISCNFYSHSNKTKHALSLAKDNRKELVKVLDHYSEDHLKYQAAEYLITTMIPYQYNEILPEYEEVFDSMTNVTLTDDAKRTSVFKTLLTEKAKEVGNQPGAVKYDIREVSSDFLIENIDLAFEAWQEIPEDKRATFEEFCQYILPYRNKDEPLEPGIRRMLKEEYSWVVDALKDGEDFEKVRDSVMWKFHYRNIINVRDYYPTTQSISQFHRGRLGLCQESVTYFVHVFRSIGIVCSNEYVIQWGNHHSIGHSWIYLKYGDEEYASDTGGVDVQDIRDKYVGESVPKVYRRTFDQKEGSLFPEGRDVTDFYMPVIDLRMNVPGLSEKDTSIQYTLNVFHGSKEWSPVAEMKITKGQLTAENVGVNVVYIAGFLRNGDVVPMTAPFHVELNGNIRMFRPDSVLLDSVRLLRKFGLSSPKSRTKANRIRWLEGSVVEGSNDSLFQNVDVLYKNTHFWSTQLKEYKTLRHKAYKYVRFLPSGDTAAYIAELAFFDPSGNKLTGNVISKDTEAGTEADAVFDTNPLTYTGSMQRFYVGYAFEEPEVVAKVAFQARNDDNHIRIGDRYELRYWNRRWTSLGEKVATDTVLYFDSVPKNSLLLLKNHTRGREEYVFTVNEDKEQEWLTFDNY